MSTKEIICGYLSRKTKEILTSLSDYFFSEITEIHLRVNKPLIIRRKNQEYFLKEDVCLKGKTSFTQSPDEAYLVSALDIQESLSLMSDYSLYAFEEELRSGYITLTGGHRVGITGKASVLDNQSGNQIYVMKNINGLNIRISHEIKGCADSIIEKISIPRLYHTMIISPPGCGKTTLLRDIIRQLSDGRQGRFSGYTVGVADERSEIAGCYRGIPQNDVGIRTDILDGFPKSIGMTMLLRAMSPQVIAVDELGGKRDINAVEDIINAGVCLVCTVHARDLNDARQKSALLELFNIFERFIVLKVPGVIEGVYDSEERQI
ncbi:MAG: stage III sporulation protein AA [Clostridiales bacterium]|jgi:stage III sporulation protein AA|nr:stage III sporulation protein AA [Clostridiales bacterium]